MSSRKNKDDESNSYPQQPAAQGQFYQSAQYGQFPQSLDPQFGHQTEYEDAPGVDQSKNKTYDSNNQSAAVESKASRRQQAQAIKKQKEEDKQRQKMLKESKKMEQEQEKAMKQRIKELKEQAKTDPSKAEELKNIQQQKRQMTKKSNKNAGSPQDESMANSNQGDQTNGVVEQSVIQSAISAKQIPEPEIKPEKPRDGSDKMLMVVTDFMNAVYDQQKPFTPQYFCEKTNVQNHQGLKDLETSNKILFAFKNAMDNEKNKPIIQANSQFQKLEKFVIDQLQQQSRRYNQIMSEEMQKKKDQNPAKISEEQAKFDAEKLRQLEALQKGQITQDQYNMLLQQQQGRNMSNWQQQPQQQSQQQQQQQQQQQMPPNQNLISQQHQLNLLLQMGMGSAAQQAARIQGIGGPGYPGMPMNQLPLGQGGIVGPSNTLMMPNVGIPGIPPGIHPQQIQFLEIQKALAQNQYMQEQQRANQNMYSSSRISGGPPPNPQYQRGVPSNMHPDHSYIDKKEQQLDQNLKYALKELKIEESIEVQDIRLRMPKMNLQNFDNWEEFLDDPNANKKLNFLKKTIYNTKQIKKTLDLRKMSELQRTGKLKAWERQPDKILRQKINLRRLKLRIQRRVKKQKQIDSGELKNKHECPVYLCGAKYADENLMIDHYNKDHKDLVDLGLKLKKSKATRRMEKLRRAQEKANKIVIGDKKKKEQTSDSDTDSDIDQDEDLVEGDERRLTRRNNQKDEANIFDVQGKGIFKPGADGDIQNDSDLEDLLEMEQFLIEKKRKRQERKQLRRAQRQAQRGYDDQQSDGLDDAEDDLEIASQTDNMDQLTAIQELIKKKQAQRQHKMSAKISNKLINQILVFTLINKQYIKETLQKEYQCLLDSELKELYDRVDINPHKK